MRRLLAVAALICGVALSARAEPPQELWRLGDLPHARSALFDPNRNVVFVSGVLGEPGAAGGQGYIARVSFRGHLLEPRWATGLNAPGDMAILADRLYVADTGELLAIDLLSGEVAQRWPVPGATALAGVYAAQRSGRVFVSDPPSDSVWVLEKGRLAPFARSPELAGPAGLRVNLGRLVVAGFGHPAAGGVPERPGRLTAVALEGARIWPLGEAGATGTLLGLQAIGDLGWYVSDPRADLVYRLDESGRIEDSMALSGGPAGLAYLDQLGLLIVPLSRAGALAAYRVERLAEDEN